MSVLARVRGVPMKVAREVGAGLQNPLGKAGRKVQSILRLPIAVDPQGGLYWVSGLRIEPRSPIALIHCMAASAPPPAAPVNAGKPAFNQSFSTATGVHRPKKSKPKIALLAAAIGTIFTALSWPALVSSFSLGLFGTGLVAGILVVIPTAITVSLLLLLARLYKKTPPPHKEPAAAGQTSAIETPQDAKIENNAPVLFSKELQTTIDTNRSAKIAGKLTEIILELSKEDALAGLGKQEVESLVKLAQSLLTHSDSDVSSAAKNLLSILG